MATFLTYGPLLILPPALKRWGPPRLQGYVATLPTRVHLLILPPASKWWGPPMLQGLYSHVAHSWATSDSDPRFEAKGTPQAAGVV